MKYAIGQQVWRVDFGTREVRVTCPDCAGDGCIRVMAPDDSIMSVECAGCRTGYDRSCGTIPTWQWDARIEQGTITGLESDGTKTRYRVDNGYIIDEEDIFTDEAACLARAQVKAAEHAIEESERVNKKEKDTSSWAWNAHYHRRCLKEAQRQIVYHTVKLNVAKLKAKEKET